MSRGKCPECDGSGFVIDSQTSHLLKYCHCRIGQRVKGRARKAVSECDREDRKFLLEYAGEQMGYDPMELFEQ